MNNDREARIRARAHELWERDGRPDGLHDDHWHRAAHEVASESTSTSEDTDRAPDAGGTGVLDAITSPGGGMMPSGRTESSGSPALASEGAGTQLDNNGGAGQAASVTGAIAGAPLGTGGGGAATGAAAGIGIAAGIAGVRERSSKSK